MVVWGKVGENQFEEFEGNQWHFAESNCELKQVFLCVGIVPQFGEHEGVVFFILDDLRGKDGQINKFPDIFLVKAVKFEGAGLGQVPEEGLNVGVILGHKFDDLIGRPGLYLIKSTSLFGNGNSFLLHQIKFIVLYGEIFQSFHIGTSYIEFEGRS